jgi:hypothetical protein
LYGGPTSVATWNWWLFGLPGTISEMLAGPKPRQRKMICFADPILTGLMPGSKPGLLSFRPLVTGIIVAEAVVIGVMSWTLAALAAWPLNRVAGNFLTFLIFKSRLDSVFQLQGLWIWLAFSVLSAGAASLLPARSAAKLTVRDRSYSRCRPTYSIRHSTLLCR